MRELHASRLPLAFKCPSSIDHKPGEILIDTPGEPARLGVATHEAISKRITTGAMPSIDALATVHQCNLGELYRLSDSARRAWEDIEGHYPEALVEQEGYCRLTNGWALVGTIDLLQDFEPGGIRVLDWKTGRVESDYMPQLFGYILLAEQIFSMTAQTAEATVVYVRNRWSKTVLLDASMITDWKRRLVKHVIEKVGTYSPGDHCTYCPRYAACPGRAKLATAISKDIGAAGVLELIKAGHLTKAGQKLIKGLAKLRALKALVAKGESVVRDILSQHGPLPCPTDDDPERVLYLDTYEVRSIVDPAAALERLVADGGLTRSEAMACCDMSRTKVGDAVAKKAERGQKGAARKGVTRILEEHGLIATSTRKRVTCGVPVPEEE